MKFDENHKVIISSLTKEEAEAYAFFLWDEWDRHTTAIDIAECAIDEINMEAMVDPVDKALIEFEQSGILRHKEDVKEIDHLIETVKEKFKL